VDQRLLTRATTLMPTSYRPEFNCDNVGALSGSGTDTLIASAMNNRGVSTAIKKFSTPDIGMLWNDEIGPHCGEEGVLLL
jgi:hypothetical protein